MHVGTSHPRGPSIILFNGHINASINASIGTNLHFAPVGRTRIFFFPSRLCHWLNIIAQICILLSLSLSLSLFSSLVVTSNKLCSGALTFKYVFALLFTSSLLMFWFNWSCKIVSSIVTSLVTCVIAVKFVEEGLLVVSTCYYLLDMLVPGRDYRNIRNRRVGET